MNYPLVIVLLTLSMHGSYAQDLELARKSHPHFPDEKKHFDSEYTESLLTPTSSVDDLIKQEKWLREQLKRFPPAESQISPPQERFGYLSHLHTVTAEAEPMNEWIRMELNSSNNLNVECVALVPAYYSDHSANSSYGFPKRFKIEAFSHSSPDTPIIIADWTQEDFPDPGLYPVLFSTRKIAVNTILLTVTKGVTEGDTQFFALDELMVFRAGNAVAIPQGKKSLTCSGTQNFTPFWSLQYLVDRNVHLGKYLHAQQNTPDFIQHYEQAPQPQNGISITVDLGELHSLGRIELHAAKDPNLPIPAIALPQQYKIELLHSLKRNTTTRAKTVDEPIPSMRHWHAVYSMDARFLRLTFHQLPMHQGRPTLALGELRVIGDEGKNSVNLALGKAVTISGVSATDVASTALLVDGFTRGRKIVPQRLYMEQLAKRAIVEKAHLSVIEQLTIARIVRTQRYWTAGITTGVFALFGIILWLLYQRNEKKKAVLAVQQQIAADLHDDISGNLGTISMISDRLRPLVSESLAKTKLREINHLSQESYLSIKEIIWHTDSDDIHISGLFSQIKRIGRSILSDCQVTYEFPDQFDDIIIPVTIRRNVMLLVKESLYNSAKYAQAENMLIRAQAGESSLVLTMRDDGCGFDSSPDAVANSETGRGLKNMEQRAKLLGADLSIDSSPGEGTEIRLTIPLDT